MNGIHPQARCYTMERLSDSAFLMTREYALEKEFAYTQRRGLDELVLADSQAQYWHKRERNLFAENSELFMSDGVLYQVRGVGYTGSEVDNLFYAWAYNETSTLRFNE